MKAEQETGLRGVEVRKETSADSVSKKKKALMQRANGEILMDIARSMNVSHSTISRLPNVT